MAGVCLQRMAFWSAFIWMVLTVCLGAFTPSAQAQTGAHELRPPASAVAAAPATGATIATPPGKPLPVTIGIYVNDINNIDLRNQTFAMDIYVWFRWPDEIDPATGEKFDPSSTFEFMNIADTNANPPELLFASDGRQKDQNFYRLLRYQGIFSANLNVARYPFDSQILRLLIEDKDKGSDELTYEIDSLAVNPDIKLPGYKVGVPELIARDREYVTAFGDRDEPDVAAYSRVELATPMVRPWLSGAIKTLLPVILIILCAAAALLLGAPSVEARIGLAITSLLALVALQFSMAGTLPEVGYLLMLDQIYIASYLFVLSIIGVIILEKRAHDRAVVQEGANWYRNGWSDLGLVGLYFATFAGIIAWNLRHSGA